MAHIGNTAHEVRAFLTTKARTGPSQPPRIPGTRVPCPRCHHYARHQDCADCATCQQTKDAA